MTMYLVSRALRSASIRLNRSQLSGVWPEVMRFTLPASLNGLTYMGAAWVVITSIVQQTDGLAMSAIYAAVMTVKTLVLFVPQQANAVSVSYLSRFRLESARQYKVGYRANFVMVFALTILVAGPVAFFAPHVIGVFGDSFASGSDVLRVFMLAALAEAIGYGITQSYSSQGRLGLVFLVASLPRDLFVVSAVVILLPSYGLDAVGWSLVGSWLLYVLSLSVLSRFLP